MYLSGDENDFKKIRELAERYLESQRIDESDKHTIFESIVNRQITLMTGTKFLFVELSKYKDTILKAAQLSGFRISISDYAYSPLFGDMGKSNEYFCEVHTWDYNRDHSTFRKMCAQLRQEEENKIRSEGI